MTIEELAALVPTDKPLTLEQNRAAWTLAKAWLADECGAELVVSTVREDDGSIE